MRLLLQNYRTTATTPVVVRAGIYRVKVGANESVIEATRQTRYAYYSSQSAALRACAVLK